MKFSELTECPLEGKRCYCSNCEKYLGDIEADTVGKEAAKALAKGENQ